VDSPYMTYKMAVAYTTLSHQTLRRYVMLKELPHNKIGKRVFFTKEDLDSWIAKKKITSHSEL